MKKIAHAVVRRLLAVVLTALYRVEVRGAAHFPKDDSRIVIVANHLSFLDSVLLAVFLPREFGFAVDAGHARRWWIKPALWLTTAYPVNSLNPFAVRKLIRLVRAENRLAIFPEGRITVTGGLMKAYEGPGMIADKTGAAILPIHISGTGWTVFSRLRGKVPRKWFPKVTMTILPPQKITPPPQLRGRRRRRRFADEIHALLTDAEFKCADYQNKTLLSALLDAAADYGKSRPILADAERTLSYRKLISAAFALSRPLAALEKNQNIGVLLPTAIGALAAFYAAQAAGKTPAMLNFTAGEANLLSACNAAKIGGILTSRKFAEAAKLEPLLAALGKTGIRVRYLEDIRAGLTIGDKLRGLFAAIAPRSAFQRSPAAQTRPDAIAAILFTSGSENVPKGVALSHRNILANCAQTLARLDITPADVLLNALPIFHSFGLTAGAVLPLLRGVKVFLHPTPLHYRIIPEIAYAINATIFFSANVFLANYARAAHPYDFRSLRLVVAGAEKLRDETRRAWADKFGVRILEGYGVTEAAPVIAFNTPLYNKAGSVGRILPGMKWRLEKVDGIDEGGRLCVSGPNVMAGYFLSDKPGELAPPQGGWHDTGDIARVDDEGYLEIVGRAKRFAKVSGEMVSLAAVEEAAARRWPENQHAAVAVADARRGEIIILLTDRADAVREELLDSYQKTGMPEIAMPRRIVPIKQIPLLATGKPDYRTATELAKGAQ